MTRHMLNESVMTDLSLAEFVELYKQKKLGRLYFPNGNCVNSNGKNFMNFEFSRFFIHLDELCKMIIEGEFGLDDIMAVITFGQAVRSTELESNTDFIRRGLFERVELENQPSFGNFLVVTTQNICSAVFLQPVFIELDEKGTWVNKGGIGLYNRDFEKFHKNTVLNNDLNLEGAVTIFVNRIFSSMLTDLDVLPPVSKQVCWNKDHAGNLTAWIQ